MTGQQHGQRPGRRSMRRIQHIHFVGIGGTGMSGIAEVLAHEGYRVSGSDLRESATTGRLRGIGIDVHIGHRAGHIDGADVVVISSAVQPDNAERVAALARRVPVIPRAEMLGELMRFRRGIAVAGTHGKTTTTGMITALFDAAGMDPTSVIGGIVRSTGTGARLGAGDWLIAEADESDASFLYLQPTTAVITNIDRDHMETYGGDFERLKATFVEFIHRLPFHGVAVLCIDDPHVRAVLPAVTRPMLTYGCSADADYRIEDVRFDGHRSWFRVVRPGGLPPLDAALAIPGMHNVLDATAAVAVASDEGLPDAAISAGLAAYAGVGRRFEVHDGIAIGPVRVTLVDDYGHHPTEVAAVLATARQVWPQRRIAMLYQPHRYTRTRDLYDAFASVLASVDVLFVLEVYAAGEAVIAGAESRDLCRAIRQRGGVDPVLVDDHAQLRPTLERTLRDGDILVTQGAGSIGELARQLREGAN